MYIEVIIPLAEGSCKSTFLFFFIFFIYLFIFNLSAELNLHSYINSPFSSFQELNINETTQGLNCAKVHSSRQEMDMMCGSFCFFVFLTSYLILLHKNVRVSLFWGPRSSEFQITYSTSK